MPAVIAYRQSRARDSRYISNDQIRRAANVNVQARELLASRSVVVIGGSERENSVGRSVLNNLRSGGFAGSIGLVNAKYAGLAGFTAKKIAELETTPDLAIATIPATTIAELIDQLGKKVCKAALIISSGLA